jgi:hypothetical protein
MNLNDFRNVGLKHVPVDTRYMLMNGFYFFETDLFQRMQADLNAVEYIYYNEEGTVLTEVNKGFFSIKIKGSLDNALAREGAGEDMTAEFETNEESIRQDTLLAESGVIEKLG